MRHSGPRGAMCKFKISEWFINVKISFGSVMPGFINAFQGEFMDFSIFLYTFAAFLLFFLLAAIGYIIQHKMIHGSCGGLANVGVEKACSCEKPCFKRVVVTKIKKLAGRSDSEVSGKS